MSEETFDLADLKEGEEFTEEISFEDDSGKETLVARSTFKVPKASAGPAAARSGGEKPVPPILVKTEYFSEDFQPMVKTLSQEEPDKGINWDAIWKFIKPIGEWFRKEFNKTEGHKIVNEKGEYLSTPQAGMVAHHAVESDYYGSEPITSDKVHIRVRNWNRSVGVWIKGIRMTANIQKTDKPKELLSGDRVGLPGTYMDGICVLVDTSKKGLDNHVTGFVKVHTAENGHKTSSDIVDASLTMSANFKYGNFKDWWGSWEQQTSFHFKALASKKKIEIVAA